MYVVDVIKQMIKSERLPEKDKFLALCMLKDLLNGKEKRLV